MNKTYYESLDETLYSKTLSNGLEVKVIAKPGFSRKLAYFITDFGSIHKDFLLDGKTYHTPDGVAHFLEHKMFELPDRDVSAEFAALGANVNAFTSYDMTAYYFSCSDRFPQCLKLLLEFVSTPYFTKESVEREYGIIDQEIGMCEDSPDSRDFEQLAAQMYRSHPIRIPILGTRESLRQITPQVLYDCHRAFYTPANMILCVAGDVDPGEVVRIAEEVLGTEKKSAGEKLPLPEEEMTCPESWGELKMEVAMPSFRMGFKCEPCPPGGDAARLDAAGYLAAEILLGESSRLYLELYRKGIIDSSFGGGFETIDGCALLTCGGDSTQPQLIRQAILEEAARIVREGIPQEEFRRLKRGVLGRRIRNLDSFDSCCYRVSAYHFLGFDYFRFPDLYQQITPEEVTAFLDRVIRPERCSVTVLSPV